MKYVVLISLTCLLLAGCNTVQGVGKDVSQAGSAVSTGAQKVKNAIP